MRMKYDSKRRKKLFVKYQYHEHVESEKINSALIKIVDTFIRLFDGRKAKEVLAFIELIYVSAKVNSPKLNKLNVLESCFSKNNNDAFSESILLVSEMLAKEPCEIFDEIDLDAANLPEFRELVSKIVTEHLAELKKEAQLLIDARIETKRQSQGLFSSAAQADPEPKDSAPTREEVSEEHQKNNSGKLNS